VKILIIGNSVAGVSAIREIRKWDNESSITVISKEALDPGMPYYSPVVLPYYIEGTLSKENLFSIRADFYRFMNVNLKLGERAVGIDAKNKILKTDKGEYEYDKLLIASGASPRLLDIPGVGNKRVYVLRTYEDAEKIKNDDSKDLVIIGGGPVGVESALALLRFKKKITIIEIAPYILSTVFSGQISEMIEKQLVENGIEILKEEEPIEISGNPVKSVKTNKRKIKCSSVIIGVGVVPNVDFVKGVLELGPRGGIVVDDRMQTSEPDIYAAGDCVELRSAIDDSIRPFPVWANAMETGKVAGANIAGRDVNYEGGIRVNSLTVFDRVYFSIGNVYDEGKLGKRIEGDGIIELYYFEGNRLIGAEIVGDVKYAGLIKNLIRRKVKINIDEFNGFRDFIGVTAPLSKPVKFFEQNLI
jgi:NADPH-dependent 2,4-dienoyl-CoA reductase/sulfur reductase-like enzyme